MVEAGLIFLCAAITLSCAWSLHGKDKEMNAERAQWAAERKDLMDRIQAPTYHEYTNKVVREKKAEKQEEPKLETDQFIS